MNLATGHTGLGQGGGNEITKCCYVPPNQGPHPVLASFPARLRLAVGAMEGPSGSWVKSIRTLTTSVECQEVGNGCAQGCKCRWSCKCFGSICIHVSTCNWLCALTCLLASTHSKLSLSLVEPIISSRDGETICVVDTVNHNQSCWLAISQLLWIIYKLIISQLLLFTSQLLQSLVIHPMHIDSVLPTSTVAL